MDSGVKRWMHDQGSLRFWALLLIVGGFILTAANLGLLDWLDDWMWAVLAIVGGAAFVYYYLTTPRNWWALIPGFALAALGVSMLAGDAGGPLFLGILGAGFATVYATDRSHWWAVIPGGVLITLAFVAYLDESGSGFDTGWIFFLGIAATFFALAFLKGPDDRRWALYPAIGALGLALVTVVNEAAKGYVLPVLLVGVGAYLLLRRDDRRNTRTLTHRTE